MSGEDVAAVEALAKVILGTHLIPALVAQAVGTPTWRDALDEARAVLAAGYTLADPARDAAIWEQGYARGVRDELGDIERADNPYADFGCEHRIGPTYPACDSCAEVARAANPDPSGSEVEQR